MPKHTDLERSVPGNPGNQGNRMGMGPQGNIKETSETYEVDPGPEAPRSGQRGRNLEIGKNSAHAHRGSPAEID
jgi:hypothetical protein